MEVKCKYCGGKFKNKRKDSKYCSDSCRVTFSRLSVTDKLKRETANYDWDSYNPDVNNSPTPGKCHDWGKEVNPLVCLCHSCGTHESLGIFCPDYEYLKDYVNFVREWFILLILKIQLEF